MDCHVDFVQLIIEKLRVNVIDATKSRMNVGCSFIRCAVKQKGIEFCGDCKESKTCKKSKKHRDFSRQHDSFVCYQKLEDNIFFIQKNGIENFYYQQEIREKLLREMLEDFKEERSKSYYCIATTVMEIEELEKALNKVREKQKA